MSSRKGKTVVRIIIENFINTLRRKSGKESLVGKDHFGTEYFEIPADRSVGRSRRQRWFKPKDQEDFQQEMPAEWESWLRGRRVDPPTEEEVLKNLSIAEMKKKNAAQLEAGQNKSTDVDVVSKDVKGYESFPKYDDYELIPGQGTKSDNKR